MTRQKILITGASSGLGAGMARRDGPPGWPAGMARRDGPRPGYIESEMTTKSQSTMFMVDNETGGQIIGRCD